MIIKGGGYFVGSLFQSHFRASVWNFFRQLSFEDHGTLNGSDSDRFGHLVGEYIIPTGSKLGQLDTMNWLAATNCYHIGRLNHPPHHTDTYDSCMHICHAYRQSIRQVYN